MDSAKEVLPPVSSRIFILPAKKKNNRITYNPVGTCDWPIRTATVPIVKNICCLRKQYPKDYVETNNHAPLYTQLKPIKCLILISCLRHAFVRKLFP